MYYNTQSQHFPRVNSSLAKRPKAAIPIVPPPDNNEEMGEVEVEEEYCEIDQENEEEIYNDSQEYFGEEEDEFEEEEQLEMNERQLQMNEERIKMNDNYTENVDDSTRSETDGDSPDIHHSELAEGNYNEQNEVALSSRKDIEDTSYLPSSEMSEDNVVLENVDAEESLVLEEKQIDNLELEDGLKCENKIASSSSLQDINVLENKNNIGNPCEKNVSSNVESKDRDNLDKDCSNSLVSEEITIKNENKNTIEVKSENENNSNSHSEEITSSQDAT